MYCIPLPLPLSPLHGLSIALLFKKVMIVCNLSTAVIHMHCVMINIIESNTDRESTIPPMHFAQTDRTGCFRWSSSGEQEQEQEERNIVSWETMCWRMMQVGFSDNLLPVSRNHQGRLTSATIFLHLWRSSAALWLLLTSRLWCYRPIFYNAFPFYFPW